MVINEKRWIALIVAFKRLELASSNKCCSSLKTGIMPPRNSKSNFLEFSIHKSRRIFINLSEFFFKCVMVQNFQLNLNGGGSYINITRRAQGDHFGSSSQQGHRYQHLSCDGLETLPNQLFRSGSVAGTLTANSTNKSIERTAKNFSDVSLATSHSTSN